MKILSPVGNFESLKMAVYNSADEVYLGINNFNARNNIDGFDLESLKDAVLFAHSYGVKVNLAINILFDDYELQSALDTIIDAYNLGVDSFIIQDIGLASIIHKNFPEIEIHASTQMGIHNLEGVQAIEQFGFKRVVLARETPLDEIKRIRQNTNIEIEYFAQGALCVSFSGNCYLSSYLCNASGNRGKCKQLCRLPYTLQYNGKNIKTGHLLSAKDFNMIERLNDLKNAGVDVIKIEGRARRPYYVAVATREYYNALHNKITNPNNLKLAFNREYTAGYFDGNGKIISDYFSHIGVQIGTIYKINNGKKFNEVFFSSNRELSPKSTFKFFSQKTENNVLTAFDLTKISEGKYKLTTTQKLTVGDSVHLITDAKSEEETLCKTKKIDLRLSVSAEEFQPIKANVYLNNTVLEVFGDTLEPATNHPLTTNEIISNFKRSDIFNAEVTVSKLDKVFMTSKMLNTFRRKVFDKVFKQLTNTNRKKLEKINITTNLPVKKFTDFQIVENLSEDFNKLNIIYSPEIYDKKQVELFITKCRKENKIAFLDTPNFALKADIEFIKQILIETNISIIANNYYTLSLTNNLVVGAGLNIYNTISANIFNAPILTAESDIAERIDYPYMTLRHCPMKSHLNATCSNCPYKTGYTYKMDNGKVLKLKRKKLSSCTFYLTK